MFATSREVGEASGLLITAQVMAVEQCSSSGWKVQIVEAKITEEYRKMELTFVL